MLIAFLSLDIKIFQIVCHRRQWQQTYLYKYTLSSQSCWGKQIESPTVNSDYWPLFQVFSLVFKHK